MPTIQNGMRISLYSFRRLSGPIPYHMNFVMSIPFAGSRKSIFPALPQSITPLSGPETLDGAASFRVTVGQKEASKARIIDVLTCTESCAIRAKLEQVVHN